MRSLVFCMLVCVGLSLLGYARAQPLRPVAGQLDGRTDLLGDPLPAGAIARFGTSRLRVQWGAHSVAFTPDSKKLVTAGSGGPVRLWDVASGKLLRRISGIPTDADSAAAISPDGSQVAAVGDGMQVRLWDVASGKKLLSATDVGIRRSTVVFAPDGKTFFTAGADSVIAQWSAASEKPLRKFNVDLNRHGWHRALAVSPDGRLLAARYEDRSIWVGKLHGELDPVIISPAHGEGVAALAFDADGRTLISGGYRHEFVGRSKEGHRHLRSVSEIRLWDPLTGDRLGEVNADNSDFGHGEIALSQDGRLLAARSDEWLRVWNRLSGEMIHAINTKVTNHSSLPTLSLPQSMAISPDGQLLATGGSFDNRINVWDIATGKRLLPSGESHASAIDAIAYDPSGRIVATGSKDTTVRLWEARTGKLIRTFRPGGGGVKWVGFGPRGQTLYVAAEAYDEATFNYGGILKWFDVATGERRGAIETDIRLTRAAISPDGKRLVAGLGLGDRLRGGPPEEDERACPIIVWDVASGTQLSNLFGHEAQAVALGFSREGRRVLSVGQDNTLRHWDVETGNLLKSIEVRRDPASPKPSSDVITFHVTFSASRNLVVTSALEDETPIIQEVASGKLVASFTFPESLLTSMAISGDDRMLACGCVAYDGGVRSRIRLWDLKTGRQIGRFELDDKNRFESMSFSTDGRSLATGMGDGTGLVWDISDAREKLAP